MGSLWLHNAVLTGKGDGKEQKDVTFKELVGF